MEKELPKGWVETTVDKITASLEIGGRPKGGAGDLDCGIPSISAEHFNYGGQFKFDKLKYIDENFFGNLKKGKIKKSDVLIVKDGATTGKSAFIDNSFPFTEAAVNEHTFILRTKENFIPKLFFYFTLSPEFNNHILNTKGGSTIGGIKTGFINDLKIPLPPLPEQEHIVTKLDSIFAHLETAKQGLEKIPVLLKQFRQAVLTQAVTGKLTEGIDQLGNYDVKIKTGPFGSAVHKSDYIINGIPLINPSHLLKGEIVPDYSISVNKSKSEELSNFKLKNNDVILGRRGEMGRVAVYKEELGEMLCGTGSIVLACGKNIDPEYLAIYLRSPFCVNYLNENSIGSTMINLNQKIIKSLPYPKLTIREQTEIVRRVEALFSKADTIEAQYKKLKEKIDQLPQAILAKAFRGEV